MIRTGPSKVALMALISEKSMPFGMTTDFGAIVLNGKKKFPGRVPQLPGHRAGFCLNSILPE
jgi:hypothetical protein